MIEVLHSGNARLDGVVHSGQKFSQEELGIGEMPLAKKRRRFLGKISRKKASQDTSTRVNVHGDPKTTETQTGETGSTDITPITEYDIKEATGSYRWQKKPKRYGIVRRSKPEDLGILDWSIPNDDLLASAGQLAWQKKPESHGIVTRSSSEEVDIIDWREERKRIRKDSRLSAALFAVGIPLMANSYDLVQTYISVPTHKGTALVGLGFAELLGSFVSLGRGIGALSDTLKISLQQRRRRKSNFTTDFGRRELPYLISHETQQHPLIKNTHLLDSEPRKSQKVGVWDVETTGKKPAKVTVIVYDGKKKLLHS